MRNLIILLAFILILFSSCFAPVNLTFESARNLEKGEIDVQGSYSRYSDLGGATSTESNLNQNFGAKLGYGINNWYTIKFRYERLKINTDYHLDSFFSLAPDYAVVNFYEIESKFKFPNANIAIGIPIGYYGIQYSDAPTIGMLSIDPRAYFTFTNQKNKFEFSVIPKFHIIYDGYYLEYMPGISMGAAFSKDLDKWAIRPEIGYDGNFSMGICLNINLSKVLKKKGQ